MMDELLQLIREIVQKEEVGTLFLGRSNRVRRLFFSGDSVHLLEAGKQCRLLAPPEIIQNSDIPKDQLQEMLNITRGLPQSLASLVRARGFLDAPTLMGWLQQEELHEIWMLLPACQEHFVFEEGSVPESLLLPTEQERGDIPADRLLEFLDSRRRERVEFLKTMPSTAEVPLLSAQGIAAHHAGADWFFSQVADLTDGFRDIGQLLRDSALFPHHTHHVLAEATRVGWLKKTRFPELEEIQIDRLSPQELAVWIPRFEEATAMAADDLAMRRTFGTLCARAGETEMAVHQFEIIGENLQRRGELSKALSTFKEALQIDARSPSIMQKIYAVYEKYADEAQARDDKAEARGFLEEGIRYRGHDLQSYLRITDTYHDEASVVRILPGLLKSLRVHGTEDLLLELHRKLMERFPDSVGLRKRFVNVLIERGQREEAVRELQYLAGNLLDRGLGEEARAIYKKLGKLAPELGHLQHLPSLPKQQKVRRTRQKRMPVSGTVFGVIFLLAGFGAYQAFTYGHFQELGKKAYALTSSPLPELGAPSRQRHVEETREMIRELQGFQRRHFASIFSGVTGDSLKTLESRLAHLENRAAMRLSDMAEQAREAELRGRLHEAETIYREIERKGAGSEWEGKARRKIEEIGAYRLGSERLQTAGQRAIEESDLKKAFEIYSELILKYPRSQAAREIKLPVRVETSPPGARVSSEGILLGTTPFVLWLDGFSPKELDIDADGLPRYSFLLDDPQHFRVQIDLR